MKLLIIAFNVLLLAEAHKVNYFVKVSYLRLI